MNITSAQLRDLVLKSERVDETALAAIEKQASQKKQSLWDALIEAEVATDEDLGRLEAKFLKVPFVVLTRQTILPEVMGVLPQEVAKRQQALVFDRNENGIQVALADLQNTKVMEVIAKKTGEKVTAHYATSRDIQNAIAFYRKDLQRKFQKLLKEGLGSSSFAKEHDPPIERMVDLLFESAYAEKASDVHIEPKEDETLVRFRIDGMLYDALKVPGELHDRIVTRIKVMSSLRTDEHLSAQDGKLRVSLKEEFLDLRVSIVPISDGEKVVMRLLSSQARSFSLADLGYSEQDLQKITRALDKPNGMVLSTGPTGSGKTTTIYSMLKILNTRDRNITSIEDPVEYKIAGANQIQVNVKTNLTFANGLRSVLRQDPDYIFVGEIRDNETAAIAVNAALTGHLVLSTLHTNDAVSTIPRLIDMQVEPFLVASTVNAVIGQRLVRKICDACRISYTITEQELLKHFSAEMIQAHYMPIGEKKEVRVYKGNGCEHCHFSGYQGRVGIFEVLEVTEEIRALITQKKNADEIQQLAVEQGLTTMLDDGMEKVTKGLTTIEEVLRVTKVEGV